MSITFLSTVETVFTNRKLEVTLECGDKHILLFKSQAEADSMVITDYQLLEIEDGVFQLLFVYENMTVSSIINLMKKTIVFSWFENGELHKCSGQIAIDGKLLTNAEKAVDFWLRFFNEHDETAIDDYLAEPYLQHNPTVADGVEAFRNEFHPRFQGDMKDCSTIVKRVVSRDNLVFIHNILKRNPSVKGHAAVDIFRFENGKIVEHWDVIQKMPETSKNDHPMF